VNSVPSCRSQNFSYPAHTFSPNFLPSLLAMSLLLMAEYQEITGQACQRTRLAAHRMGDVRRRLVLIKKTSDLLPFLGRVRVTLQSGICTIFGNVLFVPNPGTNADQPLATPNQPEKSALRRLDRLR
jgi:hypothetical protein